MSVRSKLDAFISDQQANGCGQSGAIYDLARALADAVDEAAASSSTASGSTVEPAATPAADVPATPADLTGSKPAA